MYEAYEEAYEAGLFGCQSFSHPHINQSPALTHSLALSLILCGLASWIRFPDLDCMHLTHTLDRCYTTAHSSTHLETWPGLT